MGILDSLQKRIVASATSPFNHADYPLARSLEYRGDPGLFGPGAVSWKVLADASSFVGGIRALLVQAAHPEVVAGVADYSRYRQDPLGRLSRTSAYVTATTFGAMPEVTKAVETVRRAHRRIAGTSHRGRPYTADAPDLSAWVHNALTDSFLTAYQTFGPAPLTAGEADRFVAEQAEIGRLLEAEPIPLTAAELSDWIAHHPGIGPSPGMQDAVEFLIDPPLGGSGLRRGYRVMQAAAAATLPRRIRTTLGMSSPPGALMAGTTLIRVLRWALGPSPTWHLALVRSGVEVPPGVFREFPSGEAGATGRSA